MPFLAVLRFRQKNVHHKSRATVWASRLHRVIITEMDKNPAFTKYLFFCLFGLFFFQIHSWRWRIFFFYTCTTTFFFCCCLCLEPSEQVVHSLYPFMMRASSVVSPASSGLPPYPTVPSHCSTSQRAQPFSTASSTEPPDCRVLHATA